eukprot:364604-Chlamydomonas_euryale.AAC.5
MFKIGSDAVDARALPGKHSVCDDWEQVVARTGDVVPRLAQAFKQKGGTSDRQKRSNEKIHATWMGRVLCAHVRVAAMGQGEGLQLSTHVLTAELSTHELIAEYA